MTTMATAQTFGLDDPQPVTPQDSALAARVEWILCARAVCSRCRFGHAVREGQDGFYHDVNVGSGVFPHRCDASAIWQLGEPR
jgi:hypothetical protein